MKIQIIAVGLLKSGPEKALFDQYAKRLGYKLKVVEIDSRQDKKIPASAYLKALSEKDMVIILDEGGENLSSRSFAQKLETYIQSGKQLSFIIGGAYGIPEEVKHVACSRISFGKLTWPHLLARVLLVEQLYRAQQITSNHPYHRD
jgi:23S rRNA (pseudouridine1915-N3)-methyltransferase